MIDHLGAVVVGAIVLATLAAITLRSQTDGFESASFHALQSQATSFGEDLRLELESYSSPVSLDGSSGTFSFRARLTPHDTTESLVVYQRVLAEMRNGVPLYAIQRTVDGIPRGGSPGLLRSWFIRAQNRDGMPATTPATVSQIYIAFEAAAPHASSQTSLAPGQILWEATVVPTILHYAAP